MFLSVFLYFSFKCRKAANHTKLFLMVLRILLRLRNSFPSRMVFF